MRHEQLEGPPAAFLVCNWPREVFRFLISLSDPQRCLVARGGPGFPEVGCDEWNVRQGDTSRAISSAPPATVRPRAQRHTPTSRLKVLAEFNSNRHGSISEACQASRASSRVVPARSNSDIVARKLSHTMILLPYSIDLPENQKKPYPA